MHACTRTAAQLPGCGQQFRTGGRPLLSSPALLPGRLAARRWQGAQRRSRAAAPVTTAALLSPQAVFDAATVVVLPFYVLMIAAPKKPVTQRLVSSQAVFVAGGLLYALLLAMWNPLPQLAGVVQAAAAAVSGGGSLQAALPSMPAFASLFSSGQITALAWVHLVLIDLLQARWVYQDGVRNDIPIWHSAVLCFMTGPLGLLCHIITKKVFMRLRTGKQQSEYVTYRF